MNSTLHFLCAGAAQGLVKALQGPFTSETGIALEGRFGAVGAMKEALRAGETCDLMVLTDAMIGELCADGTLLDDTRAPLGTVRTGVAVRSGCMVPDVSTPDGLRAALLAADAIYFPDPVRATAGIHFARVMQELGIYGTLQSRFRTFPNGATSMREMAASSTPNPIACTQVSEIIYSPGVTLVAALPEAFELATVYAAAVCASAAQPVSARKFLAHLTAPATEALRTAGGFEA